MNQPVPPALNLLLSEQARQQWGAAISQVLAGRPHALVTIESAVAQGRSDLDLAFITRDVTGLSTKHELAPSLQACYQVLRRSKGLRWVQIHSAGADRPIYLELRARGVAISTSSGASAEVVAQSALAGVLALARGFPQLMLAQQAHRWEPLLGERLPRDLGGQTAVLVGWGPIGQRIGAVLRLLGLKLIVVRTRSGPTIDGMEMVGFDRFHAVLSRADWLLLACPLTQRTRQLVDARAFSALPPGACLVNVARGEVVEQEALLQALRSGRLGGAMLDVFEHEPLPVDSPLWDMPRVIITPHSAGHSDGNAQRIANLFLNNLRLWCEGKMPLNLAP
ncbi:MAG: D-2-hydroxyacid dehydrogenase [Hylemonella sp.]